MDMRGYSVQRAFSGSTTLLAARIGGAGIGLATQVLLARILAPHGLGVFYFVTSIAALVGTIAACGYPGIAVRFIARYRTRGQPEMLRSFVSHAQRDTWLASGGAAAIVMLLAFVMPVSDSETRIAIVIGAMAIPAVAFLRVNGANAAAVKAFNVSFLPDLLFRPALLLIGLCVFSAIVGPLSAADAVAMAALVWHAVAVAQAIRLPSSLTENRGIKIHNRRLQRHWRAVGLPLIVLSVVSSLFADFSISLSGMILSKAELAVFGLCLKLAFLVGFSVQLLHEMSAPDISTAYFRSNASSMNAALVSTNVISFAITISATIATAALGSHVLSLFGPEFVAGSKVLLILVSVQVVRAAVGPSFTVLIAAGFQSLVAGIAATAAMLLAASILIFVPHLGIFGAALGVALTVCFWTVTSAMCAYWKVGIRVDLIETFEFLIANPRFIKLVFSKTASTNLQS